MSKFKSLIQQIGWNRKLLRKLKLNQKEMNNLCIIFIKTAFLVTPPKKIWEKNSKHSQKNTNCT